ncbi:unnamed protein product [Fraxinus pennsylvanica]|uniref:Vps72/YL1 C-terminal domain-containing protein n=1 Tax=Fraxinus pennsylvanica TaxID=56036 RepID=A0AAD2A8R1_9LAMI|nr:unnamed protein product [Fraxinus pennsylvanica]
MWLFSGSTLAGDVKEVMSLRENGVKEKKIPLLLPPAVPLFLPPTPEQDLSFSQHAIQFLVKSADPFPPRGRTSNPFARSSLLSASATARVTLPHLSALLRLLPLGFPEINLVNLWSWLELATLKFAPYLDPRSKRCYANGEVFKMIRSLPNDYVQRYLALRNAAVVLR